MRVIIARSKFLLLLFLFSSAAFLFTWSFISPVDASFDEDENAEADPDRPPGVRVHMDEGEYIRRREAFIALLRGNDPTKPIDPEARIRANAMMDRQADAVND